MADARAVHERLRLRRDRASAVQFRRRPDSETLRKFSAGFLWLGLLLSSTLTLAESFHAEMENRALEGLLLLPADPRALYYGKAIANWIQLTLLGTALVPVMVVLYDAGTTRVLALVGVIALGAAGLSAPGTLYGAMTAQVASKTDPSTAIIISLNRPGASGVGQSNVARRAR